MFKNQILALCIILINTVFLYSNTPNCDDYDNGCSDCTANWIKVENHFVTFPEWPNCDLQVIYCYRQCSADPHKTEWKILQINAVPNKPNCGACQDYADWLFPGGVLDQHKLNKLKLKLIRSISLEMYIAFYNDLPDEVKHTLDCPQKHYKIAFYEASCAQICYSYKPEIEEMVVTPLPCITETFCCGVEYEYCIDPVSKEIVINENLITNTPNCHYIPGPIFTVADCPEGSDVVITPLCETNCVELD